MTGNIVQFFESQDGGIVRHFTYFNIQDVEYIMDFSNDSDVIAGLFDLDPRIYSLIMGRDVYTVKFAVREFYESEDSGVDMFGSPFSNQFLRKDLVKLKENLENMLYQHFLLFQPECYFFIGNSASRVRMYQKMCDNSPLIMLDFKPITRLGEDADCFVLKTPIYKE